MALNLDMVFEDMVRQFQTNTANDRFREDFVSAVNKTLDELFIAGALDAAISHIVQPSETIDDLDENDMFILSAGCVFYLITSGREHVLKDRAYDVSKREWEERKGDFMTKEFRELQADVDDDLTGEGESIIGLGDVTEWE